MRIFAILFLLLFTGLSAQISLNRADEEKIDKLIRQMTLEEKVGQMTQLTLGAFSTRKSEADELKLNVDKLREAIVKYHIGSILNTGGAANSIEKWHEIITTIEKIAINETRLKIPVLYGIDAIHGANYTKGATLFPHSISLAATRNRDLVKKIAEVTAYEVRASGIPWNFNPVLGLGRQPLWSRFFETFGEDVYLTSQLGSKYVEGLQDGSLGKNASVVACMKHYLGYSVPLNGKDRTPAWIPERQLRELFLPPFAAAVNQGALTVMVNSSEINGIPTHSNYYVLTEILKNELNFKGFVVSDWEDIKRLHTRDRVAETPKEAVKMAVLAGVDMSMVPYDYSFAEYLIELVKEGEVPPERIDDAVRRILRVKFAAGLFENPFPDESLTKNFASEEFRKLNLKAAEESIILLKNKENILPLKKGTKIFVTGPTADKLSVLNGGWSITWQGNNEKLYPKNKPTVRKAIEEKFGKENVSFLQAIEYDKDIESNKAVQMAKQSDVILLCLGENAYCETPGNINNLSLPEVQLEYAHKLAKLGKPIVLVLIEGRPRVFHEIVNETDGVILAMLPGMEGGQAVANIISGEVNPSGKLPFTYPKSVNGYSTYDYKPMEVFDVNTVEYEFPFGYGLSYTDFEYSDLKLDKVTFTKNDTLHIFVNVTNKGNREGGEAVEVYVTDLYASVSRPNKELKEFTKVFLEPGETEKIDFTIPVKAFSFIGRNNKPVLENGDFIITIGNLNKKITLK